MEIIYSFYKIMEEIELDLRFLRGFDEEKAAKFKTLLEQIVDEWADKDYIPKALAGLFIDYYLALDAASTMYDEETRNKVLDFADHMTELMRKCVNQPNIYERYEDEE